MIMSVRVSKPRRVLLPGLRLGGRGVGWGLLARFGVALGGCLGVLGVGAAGALAVAPEAPDVLAPVEVRAVGATFRGVLDPGKVGVAGTFEAGTYQFLYKASKTKECKGGSVAPVSPGVSFGGGGEEVPGEPVTGLSADTEYAVCLRFETAGGKAVSSAVSFKTAITPETPVTEAAGEVTGVSATFHGELNPGSTAKNGFYFAYSSEGECTAGLRSTPGSEVEGTKLKVSTAVTGLEALREYAVCVVSTNAGGEETVGNAVRFNTPGSPPLITGVSTPEVLATGVLVEAVINPENEATGCRVQYGVTSVSEHETACVQTLTGFGEQGTSVRLTGLTQKTKYLYRVVAENAQSGSEGKPAALEGEFTTSSPEPPQARPASEVTATSAVLNGVLNPRHAGEAGSYEFVYRHSSIAACQGEGEQATIPVSTLGTLEEPAEGKVEGLAPGTQYAFCVRAHGEGEALSPALTFTTAPLTPDVTPESEAASEVSASSARVSAAVAPGGPEAPYRVTVEYGPSSAYSSSVVLGEREAGFGVSETRVEEELQGLQPATTYHYRFVVANAASPAGVPGPDETFTTERAGEAFQLPDNRAYEMVTPVQKLGALFKDTGAIRASASGDAIADVTTLPVENSPEGNGETLVSVLSTRGSTGWTSRTIAAPHPVAGPADEEQEEYLFFNEELSSAVVEPPSLGIQKLSPLASEPTPYIHTLFTHGNPAEACQAPYTSPASCYTPLASPSDDTHTPPLPFGELTENGACPNAFRCGPKVRAGTPDMSHLILTSHAPLTSTPAPTGAVIGQEIKVQPDIYEYSAGQLELLSILPGQTEGSPQLQLAGRTGIGAGGRGKGAVAARHAISDNGNHVIMDEIEEPSGAEKQRSALYLRDVGKGETIRLDEHEAGMEDSVEPEYVDASSDGSRVFFLDSAKLTTNSGATHGLPFRPGKDRPDLYECAIVEVAGRDHCVLKDLTPLTGGESAHVATVLGVSEDGSYVYFAAGGGLGLTAAGGCSAEAPGEGEEPSASALCNVFVYHDGVTRFVAGLSQQDQADWVDGFSLTGQSVRVSPNGRWLAFLSSRGLTGYDTRPAAGQPVLEVYLYHAPVDLGTEGGTLNCVSCDPSGARPVGGASVPGWPGTFVDDFEVEAYYQPRYLSDDGRVFFDSPDALVPLASSRQSEVFEFEPVGVGGCREGVFSGSSVFVSGEGGCVALISTGTAAEGSRFLEASEGSGEGEDGEPGSEAGRDVFFLTSTKVLPGDLDSAPDVFDAHECTNVSPCISPAAAGSSSCSGESSCRAASASQPNIFGVPASGVFSGPGDVAAPPLVVAKAKAKVKTAAQVRAEKLARALKVCRRDRKKAKRVVCERKARGAYGVKKASRTARRSVRGGR
jgi:hypothetical protein